MPHGQEPKAGGGSEMQTQILTAMHGMQETPEASPVKSGKRVRTLGDSKTWQETLLSGVQTVMLPLLTNATADKHRC